MAYDYKQLVGGYEGYLPDLSSIDTPEEYEFAKNYSFANLVNQYGNPEENAGYWLSAVTDPELLSLYAKQKSGQALTNNERFALGNAWMEGVHNLRPDAPSPLIGMADPASMDNPAWGYALKNQYNPTISPEATAWAANNTKDAQAARDDDGLFGDLAPLLAIGALAFGIPGTEFGGLFGSLGAEATAGDLIASALANGGGAEWLGAYGGGMLNGAGALGEGGGMGLFDGLLDVGSSLGNDAFSFYNLMGDAGSLGELGGSSFGNLFDGLLTAPQSSGLSALLEQATANPLGTAGKLLTQLTGTNQQGQPNWMSMGLQGLGSYLTGSSAQNAAQTAANAQLEAARIAADAAKFRPVGVTTRFGTSNFVKDANGNVSQAGYTISPELKALQDQLMNTASGNIGQFGNSQLTTAQMGQAAQSMFGLGNSYLATTPQQQAAKYMQDQMALLQPNRDRELASLENRLRARGMLGLSTGGTDTMAAANPALEAFYNAQKMQDLQLAANATQGGMDYAKFGAGMVGAGGDMLKNMYGTQTASYTPFQTALGGAQNIEGLGQNALTLGVDMGKTMSNAASGGLLAQGMQNAAATMQPANAYSPWGSLLTGAGNSMAQMSQPKFDPMTGKPIQWGQ